MSQTTQEFMASVRSELDRAYPSSRETVVRLLDELEAANFCDACDGSGQALSGPCGCEGKGIRGMVQTLRYELTAAQKELAQVKQALEYAMSDGLYQEVLAQQDKLREAGQKVVDCWAGGHNLREAVLRLDKLLRTAQEGSEK